MRQPTRQPTRQPASDYASNISIADAASRIRRASRILVTSHAKPDGDALGSAAAVVRAAAAVGVPAEIWIGGPIDPALLGAIAPTPVRECRPEGGDATPAGEFDTIVVVDTGTYPQLEPLSAWLRSRRERVLGFDHHARGDEQVAASRIVDAACASTTELLVRLVEALGAPLGYGGSGGDARGSIAEALFIGLATDTGWFRFAAAGPRQFAIASRLLAEGVDKDRLYRELEQNQRPARLALLGRALASIETVPFGGEASLGVAVMTLARKDFEETGGQTLDTAGLVNEPLAVAGIAASVLLTESEPGRVRASFRSASAAGGGPAIDVNLLAARFGGGGHRAAAGARFELPFEEARRRVLEAIAAGSDQPAASAGGSVAGAGGDASAAGVVRGVTE